MRKSVTCWALMPLLSLAFIGCNSINSWESLSSEDVERVIGFVSRISEIRELSVENTKNKDLFIQKNSFHLNKVLIQDTLNLDKNHSTIITDEYINNEGITSKEHSTVSYLGDKEDYREQSKETKEEDLEAFVDRFTLDTSFIEIILSNVVKAEMCRRNTWSSMTSIPRTRVFLKKEATLSIRAYEKEFNLSNINYIELYYPNYNPNITSNSYFKIIGKNNVVASFVMSFIEFPSFVF